MPGSALASTITIHDNEDYERRGNSSEASGGVLVSDPRFDWSDEAVEHYRARNRAIKTMRDEGATYRQIAERFSISIQRVAQIVKHDAEYRYTSSERRRREGPYD